MYPYAFEPFSLMGPPPDPYSMFNINVDTAKSNFLPRFLSTISPHLPSSFLPYIAAANFLFTPLQGPQDQTTIGSSTQGSQPIISQTRSWGSAATRGALQGVTTGAPFGPVGMAVGGGLGYLKGKK